MMRMSVELSSGTELEVGLTQEGVVKQTGCTRRSASYRMTGYWQVWKPNTAGKKHYAKKTVVKVSKSWSSYKYINTHGETTFILTESEL